MIGGNLGGVLRGVAENLLVTGSREPAYHFDVMTKRLRQAIPGLAGHVGVDFAVRGCEIHALGTNQRPTTFHAGSPRSFGAAPAPYAASLFAYPSAPRLRFIASATVRVAM